MKTLSVVLTIAALALSTGVASAQTNRNSASERSLTGGAQMQVYDGRNQMTSARAAQTRKLAAAQMVC